MSRNANKRRPQTICGKRQRHSQGKCDLPSIDPRLSRGDVCDLRNGELGKIGTGAREFSQGSVNGILQECPAVGLTVPQWGTVFHRLLRGLYVRYGLSQASLASVERRLLREADRGLSFAGVEHTLERLPRSVTLAADHKRNDEQAGQ